MCPDMQNIQLHGNMVELNVDLVKAFYYVVNSCQSMNLIYR